ncbi:DUF547 domain-containing protein [Flavivirga jejuensis]|uniref:DUF547 domain-containing protein n=1 Tax=Flavivirga jejuensis TaxID=870487 RepID=A0ABT8WJT5_9FLAO|nr:DUF547 domain-containing protein [Flavivirga jejuensis]MDO5973212.1 DUF547 domain-containing protein [Flavivirga jejuensis]
MKYTITILTIITLLSCSGAKSTTASPLNKKDQVEAKIDKTTHHKVDTVISINNDAIIKTRETKPANTFNHTSWDTLLQKYVSNKGNVNYKAFKSNRKALTHYINYLGEHMPQNSWTKEEKLAYWINAYNAMTIDLILRYYPINSIKDINKPWEQRFWKLGEKWYNLNEIEHQILRKMNEPRIHFAIVCASFSCPKLQNEAFIPSNIDEQLTNATKDFLSDSERNDISKDHIKLSKIFQWFAKDFKQAGTLINFLNQYSEITISDKAKKNFKDYNWNLNE